MNINFQDLSAMMSAQQAAQTAKPLLQFRAGMLTQNGTTVTADARKGKVQLVHGDNALLLKWVLRPSDAVEVNLHLFPKGAEWERVPECTDGRVFLLRFKNSTVKKFFWMQEPKDDKDEEIFKKMNEYLTTPPPMPGMPAGMAGMGGMGGMPGMGGLGGMDQAELFQMLGRGAPGGAPTGAAGAGASPPAAAASGAPQAANLQQQQQQQQQAMQESLSALAAQMAGQQQAATSLLDVVDADRVRETGILDDEEAVAALLQHLPESQRTPHHLQQTLRSPQLAQTAGRLTSILNGAQFANVMSSFGLPHAGAFGTQAFLDALQADADAKPKEGENAADDDKDAKEGDDDKAPDPSDGGKDTAAE